TSAPARADVQRLRARSSAVITGVGTVLHDDPSLNVRAAELEVPQGYSTGSQQPLRVVLDSRGRLSPSAQILQIPGDLLLVHAGEDVSLPPTLPASVSQLQLNDGSGRIDLRRLLAELAARQCNEVLVE